jgi:hypothetical protein
MTAAPLSESDMPSSSAFLPVWVVAPLGFLTLLVLAGHLLSVRVTVTDPRRRRIRLATSGLLMLIVPVLCYGLSGATPARSREFVLVWLLIATMVFFVILLALADMLHSLRLHRAQLKELRRSVASGRGPRTPSPTMAAADAGADHDARP